MSVILVIDDNAELRADIVELLQLEKYLVLEAKDGSIGFDMIEEHTPDLIICDIDMPVMTGLDLLKSIKANVKYKNIPFIIFSGNVDEGTPALLNDLGVDKHILKPSSIDHMISEISRLLNPDE